MDVKSLIAGLGNPGEEYAHTRHNFGFECVDHILALAAERKSMRLERLKETPEYHLWKVNMAGGVHLLLKPMTYMNRSGDAVARVAGQHGLGPENIMVLHDELDLELGRIKFKQGGGNNGHRGLESIEARLGGANFHRVRLGIGRPTQGWGVSDYVLQAFDPAQMRIVEQVTRAVYKGLDLFFRRGGQMAIQYLHNFEPEES